MRHLLVSGCCRPFSAATECFLCFHLSSPSTLTPNNNLQLVTKTCLASVTDSRLLHSCGTCNTLPCLTRSSAETCEVSHYLGQQSWGWRKKYPFQLLCCLYGTYLCNWGKNKNARKTCVPGLQDLHSEFIGCPTWVWGRKPALLQRGLFPDGDTAALCGLPWWLVLLTCNGWPSAV